jgi:hypothetical protein
MPRPPAAPASPAPVAPASPAPAAPTSPGPMESGAVAMQAVRLGDGVTLLVERAEALGAEDVAAIRAAAGPLLDLVRRGRERP